MCKSKRTKWSILKVAASVCRSVSYHGHVIFTAIAEVGSAHQVKQTAIRGGQTGHRLWKVREGLAFLGTHLPHQLHSLRVR